MTERGIMSCLWHRCGRSGEGEDDRMGMDAVADLGARVRSE